MDFRSTLTGPLSRILSSSGGASSHLVDSFRAVLSMMMAIAGGIVVVQLTIQRILGLTEAGYFRQLRALRFRRKLRLGGDRDGSGDALEPGAWVDVRREPRARPVVVDVQPVHHDPALLTAAAWFMHSMRSSIC